MKFKSIVLTCCCAFFVVCTSDSQAQRYWTKVLDEPSYGFAANPKNPNVIYVGGSGRALYRSDDGGQHWDTTFIEFQGNSEEFLNVVVHPTDTGMVFVGGSRFGTIRRSLDRGKTWDIVLPPTTSHTFNGESIIVDRSNDSVIYAADFNNGVIYRSTNKGADWDSLSTLPMDVSGTHPFQNQPCSMTQRSDSTNILFVGCLRSNVFRSDDRGKTWRFITKFRSTPIDEPEIPQIHFSPTRPLLGYAISSYFFYQSHPNGGLFRTTDGGDTWKPFRFVDTAFWTMTSRALPGGAGDELILGGFTEYFVGDSIVPGSKIILRSNDDGAHWWNYEQQVPWGDAVDNSILTIRFVGNDYASQKLYASTVSGVYVLGPDGLADVEILTSSEHLRLELRQNSTTLQCRWTQKGLSTGSETVILSDMMGREVARQTARVQGTESETLFSLNSLAQGMYFVTVVGSEQSRTQPFIVSY